MSDEYKPIDCGIYSRFEVAILHGEKLKLSWADEAGITHLEVIVPTDLKIHDGAEYLLGHNADGTRVDIRLDRIDEAHSNLQGG